MEMAYLILTVSTSDWHRGVRQLPAEAQQTYALAEPGFEPQAACSEGPSSSSCQTSFSDNTNLLLLASLVCVSQAKRCTEQLYLFLKTTLLAFMPILQMRKLRVCEIKY